MKFLCGNNDLPLTEVKWDDKTTKEVHLPHVWRRYVKLFKDEFPGKYRLSYGNEEKNTITINCENRGLILVKLRSITKALEGKTRTMKEIVEGGLSEPILDELKITKGKSTTDKLSAMFSELSKKFKKQGKSRHRTCVGWL